MLETGLLEQRKPSAGEATAALVERQRTLGGGLPPGLWVVARPGCTRVATARRVLRAWRVGAGEGGGRARKVGRWKTTPKAMRSRFFTDRLRKALSASVNPKLPRRPGTHEGCRHPNHFPGLAGGRLPALGQLRGGCGWDPFRIPVLDIVEGERLW